jgi:hypothetical protein
MFCKMVVFSLFLSSKRHLQLQNNNDNVQYYQSDNVILEGILSPLRLPVSPRPLRFQINDLSGFVKRMFCRLSVAFCNLGSGDVHCTTPIDALWH